MYHTLYVKLQHRSNIYFASKYLSVVRCSFHNMAKMLLLKREIYGVFKVRDCMINNFPFLKLK